MSFYSAVLAEKMRLPRHLEDGEAVIIEYHRRATRFLCPNAFLEEQDIKMASRVFWRNGSNVTCFTDADTVKEESHNFAN